MKKITNNPNLKSTIIEVIVSTLDYEKYHLLDENRKVVQAQVKKLVESFKKFGTASLCITVVETTAVNGVKNRYIADGQHSVLACKFLGIPLTIIVVTLEEDTKENLVKYVAVLNNTSKAWSNLNFLKSYVSLGLENYKILAELVKTTKLSVTDLLLIFLGGSGDNETKMFKSGELVFPDEADSMRLLNAIIKVKDFVPNKAFSRRSLFKVMALVNNYDKFAKLIIKQSKLTKFTENEKEFHSELLLVFKNY